MNPRKKFWQWSLTILSLVIGVFSLITFAGASFFADYWWFQSVDFTSLFWKQTLSKWIVAAIVFALSSLWIFGFSFISYKKLKNRSPFIFNASEHKMIKVLIVVISLLAGLYAGLHSADKWLQILAALQGGQFHVTDPLFHNDVGFYVFRLPFLVTLRQIFSITVLATFICSAVVSFLFYRGEAMFIDDLPQVTKTHLAIPLGHAALFCLLMGAHYWLSRYQLLYSPRGVGWGACYTDIHVVLPGLYGLCAFSVIAAVYVFLAIFRKLNVKALVIVGVAMVALSFGINVLLPGLVQKFVVDPNEFQKEKPYIEYNITSTLKAFGLDQIEEADVKPAPMLRTEDIQSDQETLHNVRLWDMKALLRSYKQLQEIRSYYTFNGIDTDRYIIDGNLRQTMSAVRELDSSGMQNPTWVNSKLEFTHGYGMVMNYAGTIGQNGQPDLLMRDLPPVNKINIELKQPRVYFGESSNDYVFVNTKVKEFDYPMGDSNMRWTYDGKGGSPVNSLWKKLIYSVALKDSKILFTDQFTDQTKILWHRNIHERLQKVAPFITFDSDPYVAVVDGRMLWIVDGFTTTDRYPYSEPMPLITSTQADNQSHVTVQRVNYIRNSVKAVIDAYDGTIKLYAIGDDPIVHCWQAIFPEIFRPASEMSDQLRAHLRYPEDLFRIQARAYQMYHMTDPNTLYNKEDLWETVNQNDEENPLEMDSYYVTFKLQGESEKPEFMMMTPYTPRGRDNMIAWLGGRCDGDGYGKLIIKRFSKQHLIYGPKQVSALINQTPEISAQLSLWTQRGSDVLMGHLLIVPVGNSLLYVQPLYLKADRSDLPELKRVIVSSGGKVAWGQTFDAALSSLMGTGRDLTNALSATPQQTQTPAQPTTQPANQEDQLIQARQAFQQAQQAYSRGDWQDYAQAMEQLEQILNTLPIQP